MGCVERERGSAEEAPGPLLLDGCGRRLEYLRLSVTDRCNFRCRYCLPNGCAAHGATPPLGLDEIERLVRCFAGLGFTKVRVTGGEPTLRRDVVEIVARIAAIPGVAHVGMTTNGWRLREQAHDLARAGLTCLNVSVDSLDPARFAATTGRDLLPQVLEGVDAALSAGIERVKVNVVLLAGTREAEVDRFLDWTRERPVSVRFIELMDVGGEPGAFARQHASSAAVEARIVERGWVGTPRARAGGPANEYARPGHRGRVGVIAPGRHEACARCNRLRVSAQGDLRPCLFDGTETPLRHLLGADDQAGALARAIREAALGKRARGAWPGGRGEAPVSLAAIGG